MGWKDTGGRHRSVNVVFRDVQVPVTTPNVAATIKAKEPLATLKISKDMFYRLVAEFPQMAVEIMRELAHRVEDTNKKLREAAVVQD